MKVSEFVSLFTMNISMTSRLCILIYSHKYSYTEKSNQKMWTVKTKYNDKNCWTAERTHKSHMFIELRAYVYTFIPVYTAFFSLLFLNRCVQMRVYCVESWKGLCIHITAVPHTILTYISYTAVFRQNRTTNEEEKTNEKMYDWLCMCMSVRQCTRICRF